MYANIDLPDLNILNPAQILTFYSDVASPCQDVTIACHTQDTCHACLTLLQTLHLC